MSDRPYVFGIGLNKTGTRSLHEALEVLGWRGLHWDGPRSKFRVGAAAQEGVPLLTHLGDFDAFTDILSLSTRFDQLDQQYPGSRFVLTVRDEASWLESRRRHVERNQAEAAAGRYTGDFLQVDLEGWAAERQAHHDRVRTHFADRPESLLEMDIGAGDGWELLCPFLGLDVPEVAFPWRGLDATATRSS